MVTKLTDRVYVVQDYVFFLKLAFELISFSMFVVCRFGDDFDSLKIDASRPAQWDGLLLFVGATTLLRL